MTTTEKTCEERIDEYLTTVSGDIKEMYKADIENGGGGYDPHYPLHVDVVVDENGTPEYGQFLMSWGGPSDELAFYHDGTIKYIFKDWFDVAERDVTEHDWAQWLKHELISREPRFFSYLNFGSC
tara:strand:+ start:180 stop:554 length:375 start_codon:yes stop_codon:yes gene_type:complete